MKFIIHHGLYVYNIVDNTQLEKLNSNYMDNSIMNMFLDLQLR